MTTCESVPHGVPDAENPHAAPAPGCGGTGRFEDGKVAPAQPGRGSPLGAKIGSFLIFLTGASVVASAADLDRMEAWFDRSAKEIVAKCMKVAQDGTRVYEPDARGYYGAAWLRDYVMMLAGEAVPTSDVAACSRRFVEAVSPEGYGVDCIRHDGTKIYRPGYGKMGENPGVDGSMFTVAAAYFAWKQTGDRSFVDAHTLEILERTMKAIPHDPRTGLVFIDPAREWDRCAWGFNDQVRKTGSCLTESLLEIQACRRLSEMLEAAGGEANRTRARRFRDQAARLSRAVNEVLWDEKSSLYLAATVRCRQPDAWGSAIAVWLGVAPREREQAISRKFDNDYDKFVSKGQIRQIPAGTWWEAGGQRGRYMNGGYWGVAAGWYAWALAKTNPQRARQLLADLQADFAAHGICEWQLDGQRANLEGYPASITMPLVAIRRLRADDMFVNHPDYVVFVPRSRCGWAGLKLPPWRLRERGDRYNDHFQVIVDERRKLLHAFWTQASWEGCTDHHIAFSKSSDRGRTWSEPVVLAGSECRAYPRPAASWQQPMLTKSGRLYCLWNQQVASRQKTCTMLFGEIFGVYSDDGGETWEGLAQVPFPGETDKDREDPSIPPCWCNWQRPLRLGEQDRFLVGSTRFGKPFGAGVEFWQFENIDDNPPVGEIKIAAFAKDRERLKAERSGVEEASIVRLPDGRLFALMRTALGYPVWSQSRDAGHTWSAVKPLADANGKPFPHPMSPCPLYDWKGPEAGSGKYFALVHNKIDPNSKSPYHPRGPLYLIAGAFDPTGEQPIRFAAPKLFAPRKSGNSFYTSYTILDGEGVLWFNDRKYYLLGRKIGPEWFGASAPDAR